MRSCGRLAYGLSHRFPRQTPLVFPRLTLGLFVVAPELSLDATDPERAKKQLRQALRGPQEPNAAGDRVAAVAGLLQDLNLVRSPASVCWPVSSGSRPACRCG